MDPEAITLRVHIAFGFVALFAGVGAIATRKGGRRHRRAGRTYVYAMAGVTATALGLFAFEQSTARQFLALVAVFSFYFAFAGYRTLSRKRPGDEPTAVDWVALGCLALAGLGILAFGARFWLAGNDFAPVLLVFGAIATVVAANDGRTFSGRREGGTWLGEHVFRMGAGYIATVTAFSSVNFLFLPLVARWLWPTIVGVPAIAWAIRHYEAAFGLR